MHRSISKRDDSKMFSIEFPKYAHSAILCGQTSCGKTLFVLDLLKLDCLTERLLMGHKESNLNIKMFSKILSYFAPQ